MNLLPKNEKFFELLEQLSGHIRTSVGLLEQITQRFPDVEEPVKAMEEEERKADELMHSELKRLDSAFVTPLDREDILHLMSDLYRIVETLSDIAQRFQRYRLKELDPEFGRQVSALQQVTDCLNEVIEHLPKGHTLSELNDKLMEMHRVKKEADKELREFLGKVFHPDCDIIEVMKLK